MYFRGYVKQNLKLANQSTRNQHEHDAVRSYLPEHHVWAYDQMKRIQEISEAREDALVTAKVNSLEDSANDK